MTKPIHAITHTSQQPLLVSGLLAGQAFCAWQLQEPQAPAKDTGNYHHKGVWWGGQEAQEIKLVQGSLQKRGGEKGREGGERERGREEPSSLFTIAD